MKITKLALNDILYELVSDITIDNTLTTNQDSVPSTALVKTNIDRIDNSVSEVNTQLSTIQSNLSSLQTSVSELNAKTVVRFDDGSLSSYWRGFTNNMQNNQIILVYSPVEKHLRINYFDQNGTLRYAIFTPTTDSVISLFCMLFVNPRQ